MFFVFVLVFIIAIVFDVLTFTRLVRLVPVVVK
jgi:hypothetical protein